MTHDTDFMRRFREQAPGHNIRVPDTLNPPSNYNAVGEPVRVGQVSFEADGSKVVHYRYPVPKNEVDISEYKISESKFLEMFEYVGLDCGGGGYSR